ncbi:MAG: hypothetical protein WC453_04970 [Patescibacteria group bacterium]
MSFQRINLVAADMGYGHQRAAYPLRDLSGGEIITINNYAGIPDWEREYWLKSLRSYERVSRLKKVPGLGGLVFAVMDAFQRIQPLYPYRDLSQPSVQQKYFYRFIKKGIGRDLIKKLNAGALPFVTTFFVAAYIAEYYGYAGEIYCIICDTDASRAWAPLDPDRSRTKFLVPSAKVRERFLMYGVKPENIIVSGFPLPKENIGADAEILTNDLGCRVGVLDPRGAYRQHYQSLLEKVTPGFSRRHNLPLTITYAVGGAGAQKEIGATILRQLAGRIRNQEISLNLVAGSRPEIKDYFLDAIQEVGLQPGQGVEIVFAPDKMDYFRLFNECLHDTDILWTKPSELSFYCALGLPIIISEPVGSQEDFNREWLVSIGAGLDSPDPAYVSEWLPDLLASGRLARLAVDGFLNAEKMGTYNIEKLLSKHN